jgi:putative oxidoreductase
MKALAIIGRILFALPVGLMGINHFIMTPVFTEQLKGSLIPNGAFAIMISGLMLLIVSVSIIFNKYTKIACLWLAGLLFLFITTIHIPGLFSNEPNVAQWAFIELLKDTSLMGGAILLAVLLDAQKKAE